MTPTQVHSMDMLSSDLMRLKEHVYNKCGLALTNFKRGVESEEYDACSFVLNGRPVQYRASKITPAKAGQFVTIWRRNKAGVTEPFNINDDLDFVIITSKRYVDFGQFIFPKSVLVEKGILTVGNKEGKRGIRVYPPWDDPSNKQGEKTQSWQLKYFVSIKSNSVADLNLIKELFELK
ncbi:MepB family protein [Chryseolinea sp. T2]|uniref:MepB family protein n=1 Tax=Chryseolinea sp. T2 TaxID=3129255 RepID=UPI003076DFF9